jgi:hypothetical protein
MISNAAIFIFGTLIFGVWIVASYLEFRKMENNPEDYRKPGSINFLSDAKENKPKDK